MPELACLAMPGAAWSILVHGGAGSIAEEDRDLHAGGCRLAAEAGARALARGDAPLDAVIAAVSVLEDDPRFNAGTGACLDADGRLSLDASVMEGTDLRIGAVCTLPAFAHPIAIARAVLDDGEHVLYAGDGAARFALESGFLAADEAAMITARARERWEAARRARTRPGWAGGTVGAVAFSAGRLAAATSTGGRVNKRVGRVGDSPIPGAGTYADDGAGACSCTGDGEAALRLCLAKTAIEWLRAGMAPDEAARAAILHMQSRTSGLGGIILADRTGALGLARNTDTMSWAAHADGWPAPRAGC
jgi:beta-aspartyl-peptidase (threonine type)